MIPYMASAIANKVTAEQPHKYYSKKTINKEITYQKRCIKNDE